MQGKSILFPSTETLSTGGESQRRLRLLPEKPGSGSAGRKASGKVPVQPRHGHQRPDWSPTIQDGWRAGHKPGVCHHCWQAGQGSLLARRGSGRLSSTISPKAAAQVQEGQWCHSRKVCFERGPVRHWTGCSAEELPPGRPREDNPLAASPELEGRAAGQDSLATAVTPGRPSGGAAPGRHCRGGH